MLQYHNPIIPGFYPDPSICRVGEDYYLVNSSFEFFPGVPLWHSRDLIHWNQLGHVLTRESQLPLGQCRPSGGIFAPTLRFHNNRFYMVTTNVTGGGNFYVWADRPEGPWSDPIWIDQGGIDPSLFWDDDGTVYFASTYADQEGRACIGQSVIDLETGKRLTETRPIWYGTGGKCPEGPHMYKIQGKYYLMIAEGGTEYGHMETIARSDSPWGPFESCPHNPILTHRNTDTGRYEFQGLGHADLTQDQNGQWWIVFHAIRPSQFMLHHMGRETMIAPLDWDENGWPVINQGRLISNPMEAAQLPEQGNKTAPVSWCGRDDFSSEELKPCWAFLRNPHRGDYSLTKRPGWLTLRGGADTLDDCGSPAFVGRRQQLFDSRIETVMLPEHLEEGGCAGLTVFHTPEHHYDLLVTKRDGKRVAVLRRRVVDMRCESQPILLEGEGPVYLRIDATRLEYSFYAGTDPQKLQLAGTGCTRLMATECTVCTFTGCFYGMFAEGEAEASFDYFSIEQDKEHGA